MTPDRYSVAGLSPSSRRAWIEICQPPNSNYLQYVALLAEGVDRNAMLVAVRQLSAVALLAEGVDRNKNTFGVKPQISSSPSSRRAWIEIMRYSSAPPGRECRPPRGGRG